ncbi:alpha-(1,6)-fucosyltransferase-like, partial [Exaiptasia diaphana]|uniref:Alpha-(1,6)-fucosyltransferase N- and catalytic domain-containing protein n=1 Tax=Exaiptasia diaphana TaxID=2652724 RepID=A0A913XAF3_EXADI
FADQLRKNPFLKKHAEKKGIPSSPLDFFGCMFHFLFRKNTAMLHALQEAKSYLGIKPPLLGIHIRTSDLHWGNTNKHSYRSHNSTLFFLCAREQNKLIHEKVNSSLDLKWFLAADDKEVKTTAKHKYPKEVITLDIIPRHLDFVRQNNDLFIRDILLDIFLLAECDYLLLTSGSSFSRLAAAIGFHDKFSVTTDGEHCQVNQTSLVRIITQSLRKHRH